jgi:hypothetical protein
LSSRATKLAVIKLMVFKLISFVAMVGNGEASSCAMLLQLVFLLWFYRCLR